MLAEKLFLLDTKAHAEAAYPHRPLSVDGFLYVRAAAVAGGKEKYQSVLNDSTQLSPDEDFEPLLSLAALAYERKTGSEFDYWARVSCETDSNERGYSLEV